jgi:hypothetical protein
MGIIRERVYWYDRRIYNGAIVNTVCLIMFLWIFYVCVCEREREKSGVLFHNTIPGYVAYQYNHVRSRNRTERRTFSLSKLKILEESAINSSY